MLQLKLKKILNTITGDIEIIGSEKYFVTITTFIVFFFLLALGLFNLITTPIKIVFAVTISGASVFAILYYLVRFKNLLFISKLSLTIIGLILLDIAWYYKGLSNGPIQTFIVLFAALVLWVWEGKGLFFSIAYYFINLFVLFLIEYNLPAFSPNYESPQIRTIDFFMNMFFYSSLLILLLYIVKRDFIRQTENAKKSDRLKSVFLANMSHEIRTPMNAIMGFSDLLKTKDLSEEKKAKYFQIIDASGNRLLRLISDIVDISKIDSNQLQISPKPFNLNNLINILNAQFSISPLNKNVKISTIKQCEDENCMVFLDEIRLTQVFSNLLENALKFTENGTIEFGYNYTKNSIHFFVKDSGVGINKKDHNLIFDRFGQADNELHRIKDGTGLGLSISKGIVELMNGKIWVKSEPNKGTTFNFSIPATFKTRANTIK